VERWPKAVAALPSVGLVSTVTATLCSVSSSALRTRTRSCTGWAMCWELGKEAETISTLNSPRGSEFWPAAPPQPAASTANRVTERRITAQRISAR